MHYSMDRLAASVTGRLWLRACTHQPMTSRLALLASWSVCPKLSCVSSEKDHRHGIKHFRKAWCYRLSSHLQDLCPTTSRVLYSVMGSISEQGHRNSRIWQLLHVQAIRSCYSQIC